ncbi:hypothetical protein AVEN_114734-1 [Araneus ventricosus]|uniref:Uncharacterized protein n=1 Tax=Araneus ventricosus TaxID=182803 RepID=A0A4Y2FN30_ARAVE|nr:hypothetical protein AVEN_114734-1 [Araneus ventricosus]
MALAYFLYRHLELNEAIRQASTITIKEIAKFWQRARIPMRDKQNCQIKLEKLFKERQLLKKNKARNSSTQQAKESAFVSKLEHLFYVAHADVLTNKSVLQ